MIAGFFSLYGQQQQIADSLIEHLNHNQVSDSAKCQLYLEIAFHGGLEQKTIYAKKALNLAEKIDYPIGQAHSLSYLGVVDKRQGNLENAIDYYLKAEKIYRQNQYYSGLAATLSDLGSLYRVQKNFEVARSYYNQGCKILRQHADSLSLAASLLNMGELYRDFQVFDSALILFSESSEIFNISNYPIGTAYNLGNIGLVYAEQGKYQLAEENINEAIAILEEMGDRYPIAVYETSLAEIYVKRGNIKQALAYAHHALQIGEEEGLKEQIRDASLQLSKLYKTQNNYQKAYDYQNQYLSYRDSINNEETIRKMADLRTEYEVGQKQAEVDLKAAEVNLLEEEAKVNRFIKIGGSVFILFLLILSVVFYKLYKIKEQAEEAIRDKRQALEEMNATKDKFFSLISHDLRGPISNFSGVAQLIQTHIRNNNTEEIQRVGMVLEDSSHEISSLLDNLLDWSMNQQGHVSYKPEEISVEEICNPALRVMCNSAEAKGIQMTEEIYSELMLRADLNSCSTIIRNIISNSLKFTPEKGSITLSVTQVDNYAKITIQDTGIGIPQEKIETLFTFQGDRKRWGTKGEKGVGLGLNLVKEFVDLNQGKIEVESEEGKGSSFHVYLPLFEEVQ
ncbi:ATP-binding protein [Reichenbachiella ulvae]|uniref:histidine kinase n=1 Tax=Reichenbachiella ulvae TaxID=2980104 RepID=A0ABT3CYW8_9BACT|nr:tetratricopeptide repeat-containing sensor histidine kinase [Reichenbachiella ulvae]MCV9388886.1 tetratricopeptide repeat-containing sensor histidine kinase [Reichenbachiella ulvae]